jgi:hypothetical protein
VAQDHHGEELAQPVEVIQGPLAKRLDEALSAVSMDWASARSSWQGAP